MRTRRRHRQLYWCALTATMVLCAASDAFAQTGVSDDRVSLPEGPGSLEGIGDNASVSSNMGALSESVSIAVPQGFTGLTPNVSLSYSSSAGSRHVGIGWSLSGERSIERLTMRGLPEYDADDEFVADGGNQLVYVGDSAGMTGVREYRARFEGGFVRYRWHQVGGGQDGYWTAEEPNGVVHWFGADANGVINASARISGGDGTFKYLIVESRDPWDHRVAYTWAPDGSTSLLQSIGYVFANGTTPEYAIKFSWETRDDWVNDASPGFEHVIDDRVAEIDVVAHGATIRRYELGYDDTALTGGLSRLNRVQLFGLDGSPYPVATTFEYSRSLGQVCDGAGCDMPFMVDMGSALGVNLQNGQATLIDINGDALPDLVDTSVTGGAHRIFVNSMAADGSQSFLADRDSTVGTQNAHDLSTPTVQVLDVNGDGFTDMTDAQTGTVLLNTGQGDWDSSTSLFTDNGLGTEMVNDFAAGELQTLRFMDYDNDRMIDVIRSQGSGASNVTTVYRNTGGGGFVVDPSVESLGAGFDSDTLELNDMNGDGLLDAVQVLSDSVRYKLNYGWGRWSPSWIIAPIDATLSIAEAEEAELEDINGDALTDLVLVTNNSVRMWINRNGQSFDTEQTLSSTDITGTLPQRDSTYSVLFADMNGNGSSDVVWITAAGEVDFLELYPVRPNLLSRVENGQGKVTDISYGTSVAEQARDEAAGRPWPNKVPFPNIVVTEFDEWDRLTNVHTIRTLTYHDGFFDGVEKAFRGYSENEQVVAGDGNTLEDGEIREVWDVGVDDPYLAGKLREVEILSDGRSIQHTTKSYTDCTVADVPSNGLSFDVRFVCQDWTETELREGLTVADHVLLREETTYDGYGNVTLSADLGVQRVGGSECAPCSRPATSFGEACGAMCVGDERYFATTYALPSENASGSWILNLPVSQRTYGTPGSTEYGELLTYYDGTEFVGLPMGQADRGFVTRVTERVDAATVIERERRRSDVHGNPIEELDPEGTPGADDHRRTYEYEQGLRVTAIDIHLSDDISEYTLHRGFLYDGLFDLPSVSTNWEIYVGGVPVTSTGTESRTYDTFGRLTGLVRPGDSAMSPTVEYAYEVGTPSSRAIASVRSVSGAAPDLETVTCVDGRGRAYQTRQLVGPGEYLVSGFTIYNLAGNAQEVYQPYTSTSGTCDDAPPTAVASNRTAYDALGRITTVTVDDENGDVTRHVEYRPLETHDWDYDDDDPSDPHAATPDVRRNNGLGDLVSVGRMSAAGAALEAYTMEYSETGDTTRVVDPLGNERVQAFDLAARVISTIDADRGQIVYQRNALDQIESYTDDTGVTVRYEYDGAGRQIARYVDGDRDATIEETVWDRASDCPTDLCRFGANRRIASRFPAPSGRWAEWFEYDARGQLTLARRMLDRGAEMELTSAYDNAGRLTERTFPGGRTMALAYDGANRLRGVPGFIESVTFDGTGDLASMSFTNGVSMVQTTDIRRRQTLMEATDAGGALIAGRAYTYDRADKLMGVVDLAANGISPSGTATYEYDALGRLTAASLSGGSAGFEDIDYTYDATDNMLSRVSSFGDSSPVNDGSRTIDPTRPHAVTAVGDLAIQYDAAGCMTRRGDLDFEWDGFGRLARVTENGVPRAENVYVRNEERVLTSSPTRVSHFMEPSFSVEDGVASFVVTVGTGAVARFSYNDLATDLLSDLAPADDGAMVAPVPDGEISAADAWIAYAAEQDFIDLDPTLHRSPSDWLLSSSAHQGLVPDNGETLWLHRDRQQNLIAVSDESGEVIERTEYYPYGLERWTSTNRRDSLGHSGKPTDDLVAELVGFPLRDYDPLLGRWIAPDMAFERLSADQLHRPWEAVGSYSYVLNSPLNGRDDTGATMTEERRAALAVFASRYESLVAGQKNSEHGLLAAAESLGLTVSEGAGGESVADRAHRLASENDRAIQLELAIDSREHAGTGSERSREIQDQFATAIEASTGETGSRADATRTAALLDAQQRRIQTRTVQPGRAGRQGAAATARQRQAATRQQRRQAREARQAQVRQRRQGSEATKHRDAAAGQ